LKVINRPTTPDIRLTFPAFATSPLANLPTKSTAHAWTTSLALFNTIVTNKASTVTPLTTDDTPIVLDSGCSVAICNHILDFPNGFTPAPPDAGIRGIGSKLPVLGHGLIRWRLPDNNGTCVTIEVNSLYVPQCPVNLLPPQQLVQAKGMYKTNCTIVGHDHCRVYYQGHIIDFPYDVCSNLPIRKQSCGSVKYIAAMLVDTTTKAPDKGAQALLQSPPDLWLNTNRKHLLEVHCQCGHADMQLIQAWFRQGLYGLPKAIGHCATPVCSDCQFGVARRKSHNKTSDTISAPTLPGNFVATNQMMSPVGGLIPFCTGMRSKRRSTCSTLFVDGATKYIHFCHQEAATGKETVQSNRNFEQFARAHDVHVHHYRCDNGIYQSKAFQHEVQENHQRQSFTGIGAHWQNGLAERYIGVLTRKAHIMLLHAMACWPTSQQTQGPCLILRRSYQSTRSKEAQNNKSTQQLSGFG
jgi:hypothetical protein